MALPEGDVCERAKNFELRESEKFQLNLASMCAFDEVLRGVYADLRPKPIDYQVRKELVHIFDWLAKKITGSGDDLPFVEAFGSFTMDMFTTKSDLDVSVNFSKDVAELPRDKKISILRKFAKMFYTLKSQGHVCSVQPIMRARVPIVKIVDRGTGIECDITVENKDGVARSRIISIVSSIDERFRMLGFLMKAWAKAHGINSSKDATLNSLSIISLVAFHLQTRSPPILPPFSTLFKDGTDIASVDNIVRGFRHYGRGNTESLAELFVSLLTKLSSVETLWHHGLCASTYEASWILKTWGSQNGNISVEDFLDRSHNNARSVGKAEATKIYKCISRSLNYLSSFIEGQIKAPDFRVVLFGLTAVGDLKQSKEGDPIGKQWIKASNDLEQVPIKHGPDLKRGFPVHDSLGPSLDAVPTKKMCYVDPFGDIPGNVATPPTAPTPQWGYGLPHPSIGLQQPPVRFNGLQPSVPMSSVSQDRIGSIVSYQNLGPAYGNPLYPFRSV